MSVLVAVLLALALAWPWAAVPAARRLADLLPPKAAALTLVGSAVALAGSTVWALGGLVAGGLLHLMLLAEGGAPTGSWADSGPSAAAPLAMAGGAALLLVAGLAARLWHRQRRLLTRTWQSIDGQPDAGELVVVPGEFADAFALPGHRGRPGRIVVTAEMLRTLDVDGRDVLLAHERAHLTGRHHLLARTVQLASAAHPAVRGLAAATAFQLERWADEEAAAAVGNRRLAAAAVARAALASAASDRHPSLLPAIGTGPVPRRVGALLGAPPAPPRGRALRTTAAALLAVVALSLTLSAGSAYGLHEYIEHVEEFVRP
ncbi:M48 family metalloprotease [Kitasatospora sp. NBC_00240]|uniref:M48 family metalloprotease n=1 Tax=Kitasatospora sp. NBC_00240 TaxID=2903567 RepID=UPI002250024E|nr:M48 family metalloprotease [Kitasatospora sp. NBC_00240]MCX5210056.1 M48 family metalloprotease [Kitasatospora sp. NBC_00240]